MIAVMAPAAILAPALLLAPLLTGCSPGLAGIDRQASKIISARTEALGGNAVVPTYEHLDPVRAEADQIRHTEQNTESFPETRNPAASELTIERADPRRTVQALLDRYKDPDPAMQRFTLEQTLKYAVENAREYKTAKEELLLAALRLLTQRHLFGPRFFDEVTASFDGDPEDGDYEIAARLVNEFRVTQRLQSGGELSARALVNATEQLRRRVGDPESESQSASIILSANIPLLRGAGDVAQESLISAERQMVYSTRTFERFRQQFLFNIATDYFDLLRAQAQIENARRVLASRQALYRETEALYQRGRRAQFELSETQARVLSSENSLADQRDRYIVQLERFRIRLGLPPDNPYLIDTMSSFDLPVPELDVVESVRRGLLYRLDLQTTRDQLDDSRRGVANARNDLLPDLDLSASMTIPTDPSLTRAGLQLDDDEIGYSASITFGLPIDREIERIGLRQATIDLERARRDVRETEDNIELSIRSAMRDIQLALFSLQIQNESIRIIRRRIEGLELRRADVTARTRIDAQDELSAALDARDAAIRNLRVAIMRYLLETGQFRVDADGQFIAPPGMEQLTPEEAEELYQMGTSGEAVFGGLQAPEGEQPGDEPETAPLDPGQP
ncbi:MAG: TolC family protein [Phycisphaerales bacterium]|nr:TolC family protein [Phycisphaerales bacterium]